jgi:cold shock CspA family protein
MGAMGKGATVKFFDDHKGFGFVEVPGLGDAYVHRSALPGEGYRTLVSGEPILVDVTEGDRGLQVAAVHPPPQRRSGTVASFEFARGFGKIADTEARDEVFVHYSNLLSAGGKAELVVGEPVEFFRKPTERGDQAIYVKRLDARHPWDRFAFVPSEAYQRLAGLAEPEDWTLEAEDSMATSGRLPILENYVRYTFARVEEQGKVAEGVRTDGSRVSAFNTGLVTPNQEEIYGFFAEAARDESHEWRFVDWTKASDNRISGAFEIRPALAQYWEDPEALFYDVRRPLILDWDHFVEDNIHRYPEGFRDNPPLARAATMAAVETAKQRVARNYKTAVPQFHRGEVQLLLPLSIDGSGRAQLALVVRRVGSEYVGETVLPLHMAIKNARLLARPDRDWLQP